MIEVYRKLLRYVPERKLYILFAMLLAFMALIFQMLGLFEIGHFLKKILVEKDWLNAQKDAFWIAGFLIGTGVFYFFALIMSHLYAFRLETNLRKFGICGLRKASFRFFDINPSGQIRKRIDDNAAQTHMAVAHILPDNVGAIGMPILLIVVGFTVSVKVGICMILLLLISLFLLTKMIGRQEFMKIYKESLDQLSTETVEFIRGIQVIKIFGIDIQNLKALHQSIRSYAQNALQYSKSCKQPYVIYQLIFFGFIVMITPLFIILHSSKENMELLIVEILMCYFLASVLFIYMMRVMYLSMHLFSAKDAVERLEQLYTEMGKNQLVFGKQTVLDHTDIEFRHVAFAYEKDKPVLQDLSFHLDGGKTYALVGASGSGKSTIAKLLSGFYPVDQGEIWIGGKKIEEYSQETLIQNIAFIFQNAKLFQKTIYENVAIANPKATRTQVMQAMQLAGCQSIIEKFEQRENTQIGSNGVHLSGGEKQRIAIARAILKNAKIVIFDEASAAIDPDCEYELQKAYANLMKGKTVIMIAHRLSSIRHVDEILVLENGQLVERGTDEQLMKTSTLYRHFQQEYCTANQWRVVHEEVY